jgi:hypothetical protein
MSKKDSLKSYIASETFKNTAQGMLKEALISLGLGHFIDKFVNDNLLDLIDIAYDQNYFNIMENAHEKFPEAMQELARATMGSKNPTDGITLAAALISEMTASITIYQIILKMLVDYTGVANEDS